MRRVCNDVDIVKVLNFITRTDREDITYVARRPSWREGEYITTNRDKQRVVLYYYGMDDYVRALLPKHDISEVVLQGMLKTDWEVYVICV